jgi:hypothetical protein
MIATKTKVASGIASAQKTSLTIAIVLSALSFIIYACTVFALPQVRDSRYCCEQSSVAAAISNVKYGTRLGSLYSGVIDYLMERFDKPLAEALAEARAPGIGLPAAPPGGLFKTTRDGNGIGYPLVATVAFGLVGLHSWALTLLMLALMALSAATFLWRFPGAAYGAVVTLYFSTLTVMLFTPLVWDTAYSVQLPVGGIRYFSLVGVLPIFHILLELLEASPAPAAAKRNAVLLGIQTAILVLAILVRGSALPLIGAITLVALVVAWKSRRDRTQRRVLFENAKVIGLVSIGFLAAIAVLVPPNYLTEGRFGTVIWQRVTQSLGINPAYPFPGVNEMFDCKRYIAEGIQTGTPDSNGHCIWMDYVYRHKMSDQVIYDKTFGAEYETVLRQAFFRIAARYPRQVMETFWYYKPRLIVWSIAESTKTNFQAYPPVAIGLLLLSVISVLVYFMVEEFSLLELKRIAGLAI